MVPSHERNINFESDRVDRSRERKRERETREQKRGLSLSPFFPFPFLLFPLDRSQTGSSLFSLATRGLEADTARGGHRPTIRYDRRGERSYLDSRGKNEAKKRGLLLIGDPTRRQIRRTDPLLSFILFLFLRTIRPRV